MVGITTTTLWLRELWSTTQNSLTKKNSIFLVAYVVTLVPMVFSTLYMTETERIWLFTAPFVLIPAAKNLKEYIDQRQNNWILYIVVTILFVQTLVFEVFIDTIWWFLNHLLYLLICEWHWCSRSRKLRLGYSDDSAMEIKLRYEDISDHDMEYDVEKLRSLVQKMVNRITRGCLIH